MQFPQNKMLYDDGKYYHWDADADLDNPYYSGGKDYKQLNRTEGYEVQYFIEHCIDKINWNGIPDLVNCRKIEKMIRYDVPAGLKEREIIYEWIVDHYTDVSSRVTLKS